VADDKQTKRKKNNAGIYVVFVRFDVVLAQHNSTAPAEPLVNKHVTFYVTRSRSSLHATFRYRVVSRNFGRIWKRRFDVIA